MDGETDSVAPAEPPREESSAPVSPLESRYGKRRKLPRAWAIGIVSLVGLGALAWMLWATFGRGSEPIEYRDLAHSIAANGTSVEISWELSVAPGTPAVCALQSLNESFQVVGWKLVEIPPSEQYTRQFTDSVRTAMVPVTGLVYFCWAS